MAYDMKEITLPSRGRFGGVETVTIRNLTGADEKLVYSGVTDTSIDKLIKRCVVEPKDLVVADLCEQDKYYILMQIRILTFGSEYTFQTVCPECGAKVRVTIDLDELEVFYADDEFDKSLEYKAYNGDVITFKMLTTKDINEVNSLIARLKSNNDRGVKMLLRQASVIDTINGEKKTLSERQKYLEESSSRLINELWRAFGKIRLGVNMSTYIQCPSCPETVEVGVEMNQEFFRPSFND